MNKKIQKWMMGRILEEARRIMMALILVEDVNDGNGLLGVEARRVVESAVSSNREILVRRQTSEGASSLVEHKWGQGVHEGEWLEWR